MSEFIDESLERLYRVKDSKGNSTNYSMFRITSCNHLQKFQDSHIRQGSFRCSTCSLIQHRKNFKDASVEILDDDGKLLYSKKYYFKYIGCGHTSYNRVVSFKDGNRPRCPVCYEERLVREADKTGLYSYVGKYKGCGSNREYIIRSCGHRKKALPKNIIKKNLQCITCREIRYSEEASKVGLELLKKSENGLSNYRNYRLPCGCRKDFRIEHVLENRWACDNCDDIYYMKPSNIYLVRVRCAGFQWLKLGVARNVANRVKNYSIKGEHTIDELLVVGFDTAKEAFYEERSIHATYSEQRYSSKSMKEFMDNGHSECYPLEMEDTLRSVISKIRR